MKEKADLHCTKTLRIINEYGLHTRPATLIVQCLQGCEAEVTFTCKNEKVDAKSILNLLLLAVQKGEEIIVEIKGKDAVETMEKLELLFNSHFGELST